MKKLEFLKINFLSIIRILHMYISKNIDLTDYVYIA